MISNSIKDLTVGLNKRGNDGTISISLITTKDALAALKTITWAMERHEKLLEYEGLLTKYYEYCKESSK